MLLLECDAALSDEPDKHAAQLRDLRRLLVRMMAPPALRTGDPNNALLALERTFENQVAELETHCGVRAAALLSVYQFLHRVGYFEELMKQRERAGQ